ncbi:class I SAM-dependent methyltransferase [Methylomonas fluvii]|uniref:Class I SAM-dependent methyltransferase n=1 Tax=Methylomonas fluvii TaxID=1854564 RepID=A0ABR9DCQ5_9GAMM|nr:class I SAM-dependent methyltransferase [Methylomonas fluvii]MBD9360874.1 class I SAM-dependent methyltransferase [Methylomonas fluvii]CAD6873746.1 hypothetical protein [Methylomonas fluvii]
MTNAGKYTVIEGVKCFNPEVMSSYADYPDSGFELTDENEEGSFWVRSRNRLFKAIVYNQAIVGRTKLLEIGCGTGGFIRHIVENENLEITGSEVYISGLLYAKNKLPDVDFIQFDIVNGNLGQQFDLIIAFDVLEHIGDDVVAMANINRLLRPGGRAIITVPQHMFLWSRLDEIVKHKRRYSRKELVTKLKSNGFDIIFATSFVFMLFPLMLVSRIFDKGCKQLKSDKVELEKRVKFPVFLNIIFDIFMRLDEALIKAGVSLPFGGTLVVVAQKNE